MSYSWAQKEIVVEIANFLSDHGLRLWRDDHEMTGDIVLRMVEGITKSKLILVNMSKDYEKSKNCQRELTFSWDEEKPLIPIRLDKGPYPVTRFIVGTSLYYDFSDHLNNEAKKADLKMSLLQEIYRVLEFTPSVPLPKHVAVPKSLMVVNSFAQKVPKDFDVDAPLASAPMSSTPISTSTSLNSKGPVAVRMSILAADGLVKRQWFGYPEPYCVVSVDGQKKHETTSRKNTVKPYWNESFYTNLSNESSIQVEVFDKSQLSISTDKAFLGLVKYQMGDVFDVGTGGDKIVTKPLEKAAPIMDEVSGKLS
ncbi:hypothetical protein HDU99_003327, partial [Rhizoclosmatium hyalinum]